MKIPCFTKKELRHPAGRAAAILLEGYVLETKKAARTIDGHAGERAIHDLRVALRRLRTCLRNYRATLDKAFYTEMRSLLRRFSRRAGRIRDLDVEVAGLRAAQTRLKKAHQRALESWIHSLEQGRAQALRRFERKGMAAGRKALDRLLQGLGRIERSHEAPLLRAGEAMNTATARILQADIAAVREAMALIRHPEDEAPAHETRIAVKRLRYLLEPLRSCAPACRPVIARLADLQRVFGDLHDAHVIEKKIRGESAPAGALAGDPAAIAMLEQIARARVKVAFGRADRALRSKSTALLLERAERLAPVLAGLSKK
jgi:CHAD domain-containing protein